MTFCCSMREKFLLGIVAEKADMPTPTDAADFMDFDHATPEGKPILRIKYCPFCGRPVAGPLRTITEKPKPPDDFSDDAR